MAKTKKAEPNFQVQTHQIQALVAQIHDLAARVTRMESQNAELDIAIQKLTGGAARDVGAVHRSLKEYKQANDALVGELRARITSIAQIMPRRGTQ